MKGTACISALRALGDETRLRILRLLSKTALNVNEISERLEVSHYNVSKHLRILREAGLVECARLGKERHYGIPAKLRAELAASGSALDLGCCTFRFDQLPK